MFIEKPSSENFSLLKQLTQTKQNSCPIDKIVKLDKFLFQNKEIGEPLGYQRQSWVVDRENWVIKGFYPIDGLS